MAYFPRFGSPFWHISQEVLYLYQLFMRLVIFLMSCQSARNLSSLENPGLILFPEYRYGLKDYYIEMGTVSGMSSWELGD